MVRNWDKHVVGVERCHVIDVNTYVDTTEEVTEIISSTINEDNQNDGNVHEFVEAVIKFIVSPSGFYHDFTELIMN